MLQPAFQLLWSAADRRAKHLVLFALFLVLASSVTAALAPLLFKFIVDQLETARPAVYFMLLYLVIAYSFMQGLGKTLRELRALSHGLADQRIQRQLSSAVFWQIMLLPLRFHTNRRTGALNQTLANGIVGYRLVLHHMMLSILPVLVEFSTIAVVLLFFGHAVFLIIMGIAVILYGFTFWIGTTRVKAAAIVASGTEVHASAILTDSILNYQTVKYFAAEERVHARFLGALSKTEREWTRLLRCKANNGLIVAGIFSLTLGVSVYLAVLKVQQGTMTIGEFVLVTTYVLQITQPLEIVGLAFRDIFQGLAFIDGLVKLFAEDREVDVVDHRSSLPAGELELRFEHVSYAYQPNRRILRDVSLVVPAGRTVAVVGASGAGKSSLVRLLMRMIVPNEGEITLGGLPLSSLPTSEVRNAIAVVPQDVELFNDSVAYNIGLGLDHPNKGGIVAAAKIAHIHDFIAALPDGYETVVGERGLRLSGGEQQRLAIARAAIREPRVYVFDEATSSLDSETEQAILRDLIKVTTTKTTLIIAHRLSTIVHADEIVVLSQGTVAERGTHNELLRQRGFYAAMWAAQTCEAEQNQAGHRPSFP